MRTQPVRLLVYAALAFPVLTAFAASPAHRPVHLTADALEQPLGIDSLHPLFSWQLQDDSLAAHQTAYQIAVASKASLLDKPDVWDSGKVASAKSVAVTYAGPELKAETRYYWRVEVWDKDGKPYPTSEASWWETGLLKQDWKAQWIGYDEPEEKAIRGSGAKWITNADTGSKGGDTQHDFRLKFSLSGPVKRADLFVTGKDTAAAWVNGRQVLETQPMPPWKQAPWKTWLEKDVTENLRSGDNQLSVGVTLYGTPDSNGMGSDEQDHTPMSACLYVEMADGSTKVLAGGTQWKAALNPAPGWNAPDFDDTSWRAAIPYAPPSTTMNQESVGEPWPTGPVKLLRHTFAVSAPIISARLYATALGAYRFQINGTRVGDQDRCRRP